MRERSARALLLLLILFIYSLSVKAPAACARSGKWNISLMRRRQGEGGREARTRGPRRTTRGGSQPASQPRACSRQQVPEPPMKRGKKLICIANELLSEPPPPSILGGKKASNMATCF